MGKRSRRENKGEGYRTWRSGAKALSVDSRQQRRAVQRKKAMELMSESFGGELRATRRILALDSLRKHKKGV